MKHDGIPQEKEIQFWHSSDNSLQKHESTTKINLLLFNMEICSLIAFTLEMLEAKEEYKDLWQTLQLLLTLSHSQAAVERGFSVNKEILVPNMQEESLQAIRLIHSSMLAQKISVADFVIPEKLLSSCNHASNQYRIYLLEKKTDEEETERGQKRKALQEDLAVAKKKKLEL